MTARDGGYRVVQPRFVAGFIVQGGKVTACAPILRKRFKYWWTLAVRICDV